MKKTFLFCTKPVFFLTELPPVILLIIAISQNNQADGFFKLYPLIAVLCLCITLIFLYYFRMILVSFEEIQSVGVFSSREHAIIDEGKTLMITLLPKGFVKLELNEKTANSSFSWSKDKDSTLTDMNIFRERAIGGKGAVRRLLKYFTVPSSDHDMILSDENFQKSYENFNVESGISDEKRYISIEFTKTI